MQHRRPRLQPRQNLGNMALADDSAIPTCRLVIDDNRIATFAHANGARIPLSKQLINERMPGNALL